MQSETEDELAPENKLSNSDLTGLLKAAKLAEFKPDQDSRVDSVEFEKSASLFDLVRSNLDIDDANSLREPKVLEEKNDEDPEYGHYDQTDRLEPDPTSELNLREDTSLEDESSGEIVEGTDKEHILDNVIVDADQSIDEHSKIFETDSLMKEAVDEPSEKNNDLLLEKNEEYLAKIESLKIEFDEKLEAEKQNFYSAQSALLKAMDTIALSLEEQISNFVLNTASELAGYEIDKMPTAFAEKIKKTVKQISSNKEEATIHLNPEDFGMIESLDVESDFKIKFVINKFLSRGAFEISTNKSTARVVPLNPPVED